MRPVPRLKTAGLMRSQYPNRSAARRYRAERNLISLTQSGGAGALVPACNANTRMSNYFPSTANTVEIIPG